ncbi:MAG: SDR family oxidoreductase [Candidatus Omnitrophica bacterium]|nr:SDR family oxidoreductase [Candidatus Omnitrophota bacterium]
MKKTYTAEKRLAGKVALVLGGTGDIGGSIATAFCREGATVIPTGRNKKRLTTILRSLQKEGNTWNLPIAVDITQPRQITTLCRAILKRYKRIDCFVCASGIYLNKPAEKVTKREWDSILETNLTGMFMACKIIGEIMLKQGQGTIITIGSLGSFVAMTKTIAYSVSKAGVVALTKALSAEWAARGVRVNALIPGVFPTNLNKKALQKKGRRKNILRGIPMKRLGSLEDIGGSAVFLASDESQYISGISLPVDGGFLSFSGY